ncbi:acetyl-CoA sensor PanZ family protein [Vreelandella subglaciescola]|jgi:GNAT superfamily N-acetyltransferase|uniref:Acetyltransferase (GNAT) domain-containing protein n=1 Tax=Vreelandella subglaciescola TaxID=29571 RepID=A0A1M7HQA6_9GAMM|nr:acetyl-CoA sensor PanZ family protein [Halomonas subglaciescola]SHM30599.1 Acetyltransferase (GNAT) domain-containing protein [Halomonas subglaciescola]
MPVTLKHVDQTRWDQDAQVRRDLVRIYLDAPAERMTPPAVEPFIEQHLRAGHRFACALFNARLLGAVALNQASDGTWWLSDLCVRTTTRRRGVGTRLMALVAEQAKAQGRDLRVATASLSLADHMLLARLGYRSEDEGSVVLAAQPVSQNASQKRDTP